MKKTAIIHHLGLGDHILCNGLVREILATDDHLYFPVKHHNLKTVERMLSDVSHKITFLPVLDDSQMREVLYHNRFKFNKLVTLGIFNKSNFMTEKLTFCEVFYRDANIDYEKRWDLFKYNRDPTTEQIINETNSKLDYIFVHDDKKRNFCINERLLPDIDVYKPMHSLSEKTETTIFDYVPLLEKAKEIHCMDSSFAIMIDHIPSLRDKDKYIHRYVRKGTGGGPLYRNNWKIIE